MGLFNNFPYLDLSNLNLDFVLREARHLKDYKESAETSAAAAEEAKNTAVQAAESAADDAETASTSAESAQDYAEHIADPVGGLVTTWLDENIEPTTPPVDASLTIQGAAADAKKTGDEINNLNVRISGMSAIPVEVKQAMDALFAKMAVKDDDGYASDYAAIHAWATSVNLLSISAVYTQSKRVFETDSLNSLKNDLVVTAHYDDGTSAAVNNYVLTGTIAEGTSVITVTYQGKTTSFNVTVTGWTLAWSYADGGLPATVNPTEWEEATQYSATVAFESGKGIKVTQPNGTYATYTLTPKNHLHTTEGVMELVVNFATLNSLTNIRATLGTATDCIIAFLGQDGVRINAGASDPITGTGIVANTAYTLRVDRSASEAKVYLNDNLVYTGVPRDLAQDNVVMSSTYGSLTSAALQYIKEVRFYDANV